VGVREGVGEGEEDWGSAQEDGKWGRYLDGSGLDFVGVALGVEIGDGDGDNGAIRPALASSMAVVDRELLGSSSLSSSIHADGKEVLKAGMFWVIE
jgi:hypothetical protein